MRDAFEPFVLHREERPARHHRDAQRVAPFDHRCGRRALNDHPAEEDVVGPPEVVVRELAHVDVHETFLPASGEERRDRDEPQRGRRRAAADEPQRVREAPERLRKAGRDEESFHRDVPRRGSWAIVTRTVSVAVMAAGRDGNVVHAGSGQPRQSGVTRRPRRLLAHPRWAAARHISVPVRRPPGRGARRSATSRRPARAPRARPRRRRVPPPAAPRWAFAR